MRLSLGSAARSQAYGQLRLSGKSLPPAASPGCPASCEKISRQEGRSRVVTNVGRDAVDAGSAGAQGIAGRTFRERFFERAIRTAMACVRQKRVVLATRGWCQAGGDSESPTGLFAIVNPPAMEARRIRLQGEYAISRQPIAQGMPACPGCTCMLVCTHYQFLHTRPRVQQAPGIPCSLFSGETRFNYSKPRAQPAARTRTYTQSSSSAKADDPVFQRQP